MIITQELTCLVASCQYEILCCLYGNKTCSAQVSFNIDLFRETQSLSLSEAKYIRYLCLNDKLINLSYMIKIINLKQGLNNA